MVEVTGEIRHLLITGPPGCGKTTFVMRLAKQFVDRRPRGFYTEEIREQGDRQGFRLVGLDGRKGILAHKRFREGLRVGRYGVDIRGFETFLNGLDFGRAGAGLNFVDEIGRMECLSERFINRVRDLLDSDGLTVATVALRGEGFVSEVKERADCELVMLTPENRSSRYSDIRRWIAHRLEKEGTSTIKSSR